MFFGIEKDMRVVEIAPGGGWYMEILAPLLRDQGTYVAATYDPDSESERERAAFESRHLKKVQANPEIYDKVVTGIWSGEKTDLGAPGSADMVLTFRNVHNWMGGGYADQAFASFYEVLKPGGILGVVEHRGDSSKPQDPKAGSGYVTQDAVIEMAKKAGFELVAQSEINANPKDDKDHPSGVWTLPPVLATKDKDGDKYVEIGESDRMTLKFVKK
jgi:predicted methyltransferase